jgi:hypothetical protein
VSSLQTNTWVTGISGDGELIVGYAGASLTPPTPVEGFVDYEGKMSTFNAPGAIQTFFNGVNDLGVAVGYGISSESTVGSFLYRGGAFEAFTISGAATTIPNSISDAGVIVGSYTPSSNPNVVYGFIATP